MKTIRQFKIDRLLRSWHLMALVALTLIAELPMEGYSQSPETLNPLNPKFATLRRARISPGLGIDFINAPIELRMNTLDIFYDSTRKEWGYGINAVFDIFSPASMLGVYTQIGYHWQNFTVQNPDQVPLDIVKTSFLQLAGQLKLRTGPDTKQTHGIFMTGFSLRRHYKNESLSSSLPPMRLSQLSLVFSAGIEVLYVQYQYGIRIPRTMLTASYHHPLSRVFEISYMRESWGVSNPQPAEYRLGSLLVGLNFML